MSDYLSRLAEGIDTSGGQPKEDQVPVALSGYSRAQILQSIGVDEESGLQIRAARLNEQAIVVLAYRSDGSMTDLNALGAQVFALEERSGELSRRGGSRLAFKPGQCIERNPAPGHSQRELDVEASQSNSGQTEFIVHLTCSISELSRDGEETYNVLFEARDAGVHEVLSYMSSRSELDRAGGFLSTEVTSLESEPGAVTRRAPLVLKTRMKRETSPLDGSSPHVVEERVLKRSFKWSGKAYVQTASAKP